MISQNLQPRQAMPVAPILLWVNRHLPELGTVENDVLIGRDGYLFLAGGGHDVADFVTGKREVDPVYFKVFRQNIESRAAWAAGAGASFLHVIMPDKQSIIPDAWTLAPPVRLGGLYAERNRDLAGQLVYPAPLLAQYRNHALCRVDTHLTAFGSAIVARHLAERILGAEQEQRFREIVELISRDVVTAGDLGSKLNPPVEENILTWGREPPGYFYGNLIPGGNNGGVDLRFNPQAPCEKRVVFFGDSFGRDIAHILQFWFREVYFFRSGFFHPEIAALCRPDVLITENVERYMSHCVSDEERPHFLLYPHLTGKHYEPSQSFAEALSAVLAYPRQPYADFIEALSLRPLARVEARRSEVMRYDKAPMTDPPEAEGVLKILEAPKLVMRRRPEFVADLSGRGLALASPEQQDIHGSYLVRREAVLLFGPNHLITPEGYWSCEARSFKRQFLWYMHEPFYDRMYPGPKPLIDYKGPALQLTTSNLAPGDVEKIDIPVFLATALEPPIWGRWIATVAPKVMHFKQHGEGRKFFCYAALDWQKAFLKLLGIQEHELLQHDPGRSYICDDVMTVEYSVTNMTISAAERANFFEMVASHHVAGLERPRKLFVSRLSRSKANPNYRVLQNEAELAAILETLGFATIEPETLPFARQIALFGAAEQVVFVGGSGVYNAVFCAPGTSVVTIESSDTYILGHTELLSSLGLRYGVIFGREDPEDLSTSHRRWSVDVEAVRSVLEPFFAAA